MPKISQIYYVSGDLLHGCSLTTLLFSSNNLQFTMADTSKGSTPGTNTFGVRIQKIIPTSQLSSIRLHLGVLSSKKYTFALKTEFYFQGVGESMWMRKINQGLKQSKLIGCKIIC